MSSQFPTNFFECQLVLNIIEPLRVSLLEAIEVDGYACRVMGKMIEESKEKVQLIDVGFVSFVHFEGYYGSQIKVCPFL